MFIGFFYLLRSRGFGVSLGEWLTLLEGLMLDLHRTTLTGFYDLCRAVLVKTEAEYDKFDGLFLEYFKGIPFEEELPEELMDWLNKPTEVVDEMRAFLKAQGYEEKTINEILKMFEERLKEQKEEHNGGNYWIGTRGSSSFGNNGLVPQGIRVGGESKYRHAFKVAGERTLFLAFAVNERLTCSRNTSQRTSHNFNEVVMSLAAFNSLNERLGISKSRNYGNTEFLVAIGNLGFLDTVEISDPQILDSLKVFVILSIGYSS